MKPLAIWMLGGLIAFGIAAWAGAESQAPEEPTELHQAQHSREWALQQFQRSACLKGETAVWVEDKVAQCLRELP